MTSRKEVCILSGYGTHDVAPAVGRPVGFTRAGDVLEADHRPTTVADMSAFPDLRTLRRPLVLIAFHGWNDAGEGATSVIDHLADATDADLAFALDPEDYYDFTTNRPIVVADGVGNTHLEWSTTELLVGRLDNHDLVLITGPEPNYHWRDFSARLLSAIRSMKPERVIFLGALLADVPHRRPVQIAENDTTYEGPTGIVGVLTQKSMDAGLPTTWLWASVPHYVAEPPNPKVTWAFLQHLSHMLDLDLPTGDLPQQAAEWQARVDELVSDPELASYISSLEEHYDDEFADGDKIVADIERYLRRRRG